MLPQNVILLFSDPLVIDDLEFNRTSLTLTCTTSGGPTSSITWLKDGEAVGTEFAQAQVLIDTLTAMFKYTLRSDDVSLLVGSFTCMVEDAEGNSPPSRTLILNGTVTEAISRV